jgi:hypothetical protein
VRSNPVVKRSLPALSDRRFGMRNTLCPGYFNRDVQEIIDKNGIEFCAYYCALCGRQVKPVFKDGGWIPRRHDTLNDQYAERVVQPMSRSSR